MKNIRLFAAAAALLFLLASCTGRGTTGSEPEPPVQAESRKLPESGPEEPAQPTPEPEEEPADEPTAEPTAEPAAEPTPEPTAEPEAAGEESPAAAGVRPEFQEAMDSYEAFMDEYCEIMQKYGESDGTDLSLLADYASYMAQYAEMMQQFEQWEDEELSDAELLYYIEVQARVNQKLLEVAD